MVKKIHFVASIYFFFIAVGGAGPLDPPAPSTVITTITPAPVAGVIDSARPTIAGKAPRNSQVQLWLNGVVAATGFANATGDWSISLPAQLNGSYSLIARSIPGSPETLFSINDPLQPLLNFAGTAAIFDMDTATGVYWTNGLRYTTQADLITAVGGSLAGQILTVGPYVDPLAAEYITNGTFDSATTGWTASANATISISSGEFVVDGTVASASAYQALAGYPGRAFAFTGTGRRGTNAANSPFIAATTQAAGFPGNFSSGTAVTASNSTSTIYISSGAGSNTWFGVKYSSGTGTSIWDNFTVKEVMPMAGWASFAAGDSGVAGPGWGVLIEGTAPASLPGSGLQKVIYQADAAQERDLVKLHWSDTGTVILSVKNNNASTATLTLGSVAAGSSFRVAATINKGTNATGTGVAGSLKGGNSLSSITAATTSPGVSHVRLAQNSSGGSTWDGTITRLAIVPQRQPTDWLEINTVSGTALWSEGDSYMDGAGGVVLNDKLETALGYPVVNSAVGGSTLAGIRSRIIAKNYLRNRPLVIWDGSANGFTDVASSLALMQEVRDWKGDANIVWIASIATPNPATASSPTVSAYTTSLVSLRNAAITAFGSAHVYDPLPVLQALGNGGTDDNNDIAAGLAPRSTLLTQNSGEVHLSNAAMNAVAADSVLLTKIAAID